MAAGATLLPGGGWRSAAVKKEFLPVSRQDKPLAIAMWDYSWILRHHRYGEFENWDRVLEGLAERGYNAIRMDAMPQYVAADSDGTVEAEFRSVKDGWSPSMWGNDYTMSFRPREALLEFLPKCEKQGIRVGLATWFINHGTTRKNIFLEEGGLARAWSETLNFLKSNDLLKNILYVDILNEYPNWHGYEWFLKEMRNTPEEARKPFYNEFMSGTLRRLKLEFPGLDFFASIDSGMNLANIDLTEFDAMDYHIWFDHRGGIPGLSEVSSKNQTLDYRKIYANMMLFWKEKRSDYIGWMEGRLSDISGAASANGIVCGNTEGWGPIFWLDHPELDWGWVKESAEICVDLARRHNNYKFICTSNFTHPQFRGMWEDIRWHRRITSKIKA